MAFCVLLLHNFNADSKQGKRRNTGSRVQSSLIKRPFPIDLQDHFVYT